MRPAKPAVILCSIVVASACLPVARSSGPGSARRSPYLSPSRPNWSKKSAPPGESAVRKSSRATRARWTRPLRLLPGVYIRTGGDGRPRMDIRGFRSRHVLLLINGVQVNSTDRRSIGSGANRDGAIREIKVSYGRSSRTVWRQRAGRQSSRSRRSTNAGWEAEYERSACRIRGAWGRVARNGWRLVGDVVGDGVRDRGYRLPGSLTPTSPRMAGGGGTAIEIVANSVGSDTAFTPQSELARNDFHRQLRGASQRGGRYQRHLCPGDPFRASRGLPEGIRSSVRWSSRPGSVFDLRGWVYRNAQREERTRYDDATYSVDGRSAGPGRLSVA